MKSILYIITCMILLSSCSRSPVNGFIDKVKENDSAVAMTIPGWLIRTGTNLALKGVKDEDERAIFALGKKIKKIRFVADEKNTVTRQEINEVIAQMKLKGNYEPYTTVRHKDADVYVMVQEDKDKIKHLAIFAHGDESIFVLDIKTEITFEELSNSKFSWNKKEASVE